MISGGIEVKSHKFTYYKKRNLAAVFKVKSKYISQTLRRNLSSV